jgi:hypothetical protein
MGKHPAMSKINAAWQCRRQSLLADMPYRTPAFPSKVSNYRLLDSSTDHQPEKATVTV